MTPLQEQQLLEDVNLIKQAIMGEKKLELPGLMVRVHKLEKWRRSIDLRIAGISGMMSGIVLATSAAMKWLFKGQ